MVSFGCQYQEDIGNAISKSSTKQHSNVDDLCHLFSECGSVIQEGGGLVGGEKRKRSSNVFGRRGQGRGGSVFAEKRRGRGRQGRGGVGDVGWLVNRDQSGRGKQKRSFVYEKVPGTKKVWDTLHATTVTAVAGNFKYYKNPY